MVEIEHDDALAAAQNKAVMGGGDDDDDDSGVASAPVLPCSLDDETRVFVEKIFDEDMFKEVMSSFKLDPKKLPLGALSVKQLDRGVAAMQAIEQAVKQRKGAAEVGRLSGVFYATIPHSFGMQRPPPVDTLELIREKYEMLQVLRDIEEANQMATESKTPRKKKGKSKTPAAVPHPLDAKYEQLNATLTLMGSKDPDFQVVQTYLQNTSQRMGGAGANAYLCSPGHNKLRTCWRVDRHGEGDAFQTAHGAVGNRWLLWHGTNVAVVAAILKSGLRIMPHSGGRVGRGIYLADCQAKSAHYTQPTYGGGRAQGVMFLVEAPLGVEHTVTQDGEPSSYTAAPSGCDSVVARGKYGPQPSWPGSSSSSSSSSSHVDLVLDGNPVRVPQGQMGPTDCPGSSFMHNEILVYKESQHRIRYVLLIDW